PGARRHQGCEAPLYRGADGGDHAARRRCRAADPDPGLDAAAVGDAEGLGRQTRLAERLAPLPGGAPRRRPTRPEPAQGHVALSRGEAGMSTPLLDVKGLSRRFDVSKPWLNRVIERSDKLFVHAVEDVSFSVPRGKTFALVGESGSGKSTIAKLIVGLIPPSE